MTRTPLTRQAPALRKTTLPPLSAEGPCPSSSSTHLLRDRKRSRLTTPPICPFVEADELSNTPRSARIAKLFPGGSTPRSLDVLIERLIAVTKATLVPKSKKTSSIKVDIESAADILLLTGMIKEQASVNDTRRTVFDTSRKTVTDPASALTSTFEFRVSTIADRVDVLSEHIAKLVADGLPEQARGKKPPPKTSYASAASKHASSTTPPQDSASQPRPHAPPKVGPRLRSDHTITLSQLDPANIAGAEKSVPELIKALNLELKVSKIKVKPEDTTTV
ncbi:hypothetical protein DFH28DRAFT_902801, partial [Melampsora americana]